VFLVGLGTDIVGGFKQHLRANGPLPDCRFPPPWSAEETDACFIVRDANGQALAYVSSRSPRARSRS
jgi:hypothetical protein